MRTAVLFLAGMAFVAGFNQHAEELQRRSQVTLPPTTAEEFAAFQHRWRTNLAAAGQLPPAVDRPQVDRADSGLTP